MLRSVLAKYQYELQDAIAATLRDVLAGARPDPNDEQARRLEIDDANVVEVLNRRIASIDGSLSLVVRVQGTGSEYVITRSSFDKVRKSLD